MANGLFFDVDPRIPTALGTIGAALQNIERPGTLQEFQEQQRRQREQAELEKLGLGSPAARALRLSQVLSGQGGRQLQAGEFGPAAPGLAPQEQLGQLAQLAALGTPGAVQGLQSQLQGQITPEEERAFALRERALNLEAARLAQSRAPQMTALQQNLQAAGLQPGTPAFQEAVLRSITKPQVAITQGAGPTKFEEELGKKRAAALAESEEAARQAVSSLEASVEANELLKSGIITGKGANFLTEFGKGLNTVGLNFAEDSIANTEAFVASRAQEVGRIIQLFGAGTGLSDADREFAQQAAAGKISMTEKSIRRILDINERASRNVIKKHNKRIQRVPQDIRERLFLDEVQLPVMRRPISPVTPTPAGSDDLGVQNLTDEDLIRLLQ